MENWYAGARQAVADDPDFVDLIDTNFHRCGFRYPPDKMRRSAMLYFTESDKHNYNPDPAGDPELRAAIASYYRDAGVVAESDSVVVTASASESYSHIFASRCSPGDRVLLPRPGYPLFEDIAARSGLSVDFYDQQPSAGWEINTDQLQSLIGPRTAAIVLISPNNPTGSVVSDSTIVSIGELCERHALFLVVDEVFSEMLFGSEGGSLPARLPRAAHLLPGVSVYTINGVSKLFASPDLKTSWVLASGPTIGRRKAIEELLIQNDLYLSASSMSQFIASRMFASGLNFTRWMVDRISRRREIMLDGVDRIAGLSAIPPTGGIHLPVAVSADVLPDDHDDEEVAVDLLLKLKLAVHPGYLYGFESNTVVMSYLAPEKRILDGLARLDSYFRSPSR